MRKLRAILLLGGSLRPSPLASQLDRSVLDLPIAPGISLLQAWQLEAADLAQMLELEALPVRLLLDRHSRQPARSRALEPVDLSVERDRSEYRGTAGILRDATEEYDDDDYVLVASAAQAMLHPLTELVRRLAETGGDAAVLSRIDGVPTSVMLLRCDMLRSIPTVGYMDLKEQVLARIARDQTVSVVAHQRASLPLRTLDGYIAALRTLKRAEERAGEAGEPLNPFVEDWRPAFSISEANARVAPGARLHDSVVLDGGVVEEGAALFDSIVCAGGVVRRGETVVQRVLRR